MAITRGQMTKQVEGQLRGARKKKAPKGYHYMPNGRLMKDSAHAKKQILIAKDLRSRKYNPKVVQSKKLYNRKKENISLKAAAKDYDVLDKKNS
jgi:Skp family chaperone for outer membrane proteins